MEVLKNSHVAVFGVGGVGSYVVEALVRSGIGAIDVFDSDKVSLTNINRQLYATSDTIGEDKVDVAEKRILSINEDVKVGKHKIFFTKENSNEIDFSKFDYIVDAIDTVTGKIELVVKANEYNVPIISSMGAGNKVDPTKFLVSDIYETSVCPLAKVLRGELKKRGIKKLKVVYSKEPLVNIKDNIILQEENTNQYGLGKPSPLQDSPSPLYMIGKKKQVIGSVSFVPPVVGLIIAGEVIKDLIGYK